MAESNTLNSDDTPSLASNGIVMLSPPEESSLPSSSDGVDRCAVNHGVNVDAGSQGFVDSGKHSDLGFSEVQPMQEMDVEGCSHGAPGDVLGDILDDYAVFEKEKEISTNKSCSERVAPCSVEGNKSRDGILKKPSIRRRSENAGSGMECGNSRLKKNLDDLSLLEVAMACGITFTRPKWWPDGDNFKP